MRILMLAALLSLCSLCHAQLVVTATPMRRLDGLEDLITVGDVVLSPGETKITQRPASYIEIDTTAKNIDVQVTDIKRLPVPFVSMSDRQYLVDVEGKFWVEVTVFDSEQNIFARKTVVVEVGPPPDPDDPDVPDPPDPDGPFDGLAARLAKLAEPMTDSERKRIRDACIVVAGKMDALEYRRVDQATEYIARNWPQPCDTACRAVYEAINQDARERSLGWQEAIEFYRQIAKGME